MALTLPPTVPTRDMAQATFDAAVSARLEWDATNVQEMNAFQSSLTSIAAGTAFSMGYTFSTTTTDSDPGAGYLRLSSSTQNASTVIRLDLVGSDASTWTSVIDSFDDSSSTIKGQITLVKLGDATKWLTFNVTSLASPAGYKNLTVSNVSSSATSPFSNNDTLIVKFTRNGDKGDVGGTVTDSEIVVHTGNGYGSTNTKIRRYTTAMTSVGSDITYVDSSTLGATFTINTTSIYSIYLSESTSSSDHVGVSVNSAELTTGVNSILVATRLLYFTVDAASNFKSSGRCVKLTAGDVIRVHATNANGPASNLATFAIRKVSSL